MSDPIRVAVVAEGPTDTIVIQAALRAILNERPFVLTQLQPEGSVAFGQTGSGWGGVYRWCKQSRLRGNGRLSDDHLLFSSYDLLICHVDGEIADEDYPNAGITREPGDADFPGMQPCPPSAGTADAVRALVLNWCREVGAPEKMVLCVPCMSTETWVMASIFPNDEHVHPLAAWECHQNPEARLGQQPKTVRIRKSQADYRGVADQLTEQWPRISGPNGLSQASRFTAEVRGSHAFENGAHP